MRTSADVLRSIQRYMWRTFEGDVPPLWQNEQREWEIRMWGTEGEFGFPFVRVAAVTPINYTGPATWREATQTFAVHVYPVPLADPEASIMEVERVQEILFVAFEQGLIYVDQPDLADPLTWVSVKTAPRRIPLYDYDGVPLDGPNSVSYARSPNDFVRVLDAPVNRIVDPEDDTYWLLTVEARVSWRRAGRVIGGPNVVRDVTLRETGS